MFGTREPTRRTIAACFAAPCLLALLVRAAPVSAQEIDESARGATREMAYEGIKAYKEQHYDVAWDKISRAYTVIRVPTLGLWTARTLEKLGRLVEASERYREIARLSISQSPDVELQQEAKHVAATELAALEPRIPKLRVVIQGVPPEGVTVTIDKKPLPNGLIGTPVPVNPGEHQVTATLGKSTATGSAKLDEKGSQDVVLKLTPLPTDDGGAKDGGDPNDTRKDEGSGSTQRTLGFVAIGVGGVALAGGVVFGIMAVGTKNQLDAGDCLNHACGPSQHENIDKLDQQKMFSTVGIIAGSVLAAGGVALYLTAPKHRETAPSAALVVGPGSAGLKARF